MRPDDEEEKDFPKTGEFQHLEQVSAMLADTLPPMMRRMFVRLTEEGFTEDQALQLVKVYLLGTASVGTRL